MDKGLLLKPVPKLTPRGCTIEKKYPFPIFRQSSATDESKQDWQCFTGHLQADCVLVSDEDSMNILFSMGFFGKSTLSKRTPGFQSSERSPKQSAEDHGSSSENDIAPASKRKKTHHEIFSNVKVDPATSSEKNFEVEHSLSSSVEGEKESLQLTFHEAFFLSYGLGCLVVMDNNKPLDLIKLWKKFCELSPCKNFPVMYAAYHHFRAKGWVVRSGLNYGADYGGSQGDSESTSISDTFSALNSSRALSSVFLVLYKDGPSFYHSTYSVIVKAIREKDLSEIESSGRLPMTWAFLSALNRVNSHVGKGVMFTFVVKPELMSDHMLITPVCISRFKVQELLIRRWVPSAEREK